MTGDLRVALLAGDCPPVVCGVGDFTMRLAAGFRAAGATCEIWTRRTVRPPQPETRPSGVRSVVRTWRLAESLRVWAHRARLGPGVVHLQYEPYAFHFRWGPVGALALAAGTRVVTFHEPAAQNRRERARLRALCRLADAVVVNDQETEDYVRGLVATPPPVVTIGVGSNIEAPALATPLATPGYLATFGIVKPHKGLELAIRSYGLLAAGLAPASPPPLLVAGAGAEGGFVEALAGLAREAGVAGSVRFLGAQTAEEIATLLRDAALCLLPFPEGPSLRRTTLHSAWRYGCPVVTTPEQHRDPVLRTGLLFAAAPAATPDAVAATARALLADPARRAALADAGRGIARQFATDVLVARHLELYQRLQAGS